MTMSNCKFQTSSLNAQRLTHYILAHAPTSYPWKDHNQHDNYNYEDMLGKLHHYIHTSLWNWVNVKWTALK